MKTILILTATLLALCIGAVADGHTTKRSAKAEPAAAVMATPAPPATLEQMPAKAPQVTFQNGQMTIVAENSTLADILRAVKTQTGADVEFPGSAPDRVVGHFGPGPARDVLGDLLNGSHFNYVLLGSATNPDALDRVILTAKSGGAPEASPPAEQTAEVNQQQQMNAMPPAPYPGAMAFRNRMGMMAPQNQNTNTVTAQPEEATDDSASSDDDADSEDEQADDDQANADDNQQTAGDMAPGQGSPNGQQNGVKSPEQLLQELQQQQQQQLQQGQPGFPQPPGMPGMPGGQQPHNQ